MAASIVLYDPCKWELERRAAVYMAAALRDHKVEAPYIDFLLLRLLERALQQNQLGAAHDIWRTRDRHLVGRLRSYAVFLTTPTMLLYDACIDRMCEVFFQSPIMINLSN